MKEKVRKIPVSNLICMVAILIFFGVFSTVDTGPELDNVIYLNGVAVELVSDSTTEPTALNLEEDIVVTIDSRTFQTVKINGDKVTESVTVDATSTSINIVLSKLMRTTTCIVRLIPTALQSAVDAGQYQVQGDGYVTTGEGACYQFTLSQEGAITSYQLVE